MHLLVPQLWNYPLVDAVIIVVHPPKTPTPTEETGCSKPADTSMHTTRKGPERAAKSAGSKGTIVVVGVQITRGKLADHAHSLDFVMDEAEGPWRKFLPYDADREKYQISGTLLWVSEDPVLPWGPKKLPMRLPIDLFLS